MSKSNIPAKHIRAMDMVYPLADALQMTLDLNVSGRGTKFSISGSEKFDLPVTDSFDLDLKCKVRASNITMTSFTKMESWVLVEISLTLWVLLAYLKASRELYFAVIDMSRVDMKTDDLFENRSSVGIKRLTEKGIVFEATRSVAQEQWRVINAGGVDAGRSGKAEKGNPQATQSGAGSTPSS